MTTRLHKQYLETIVPQLMKELELTNPMQVPRIEKITINMGVGEAVADKKLIDNAVGDLVKITGQKPLLCKSRKSIASFKLRGKRIFAMAPIHHHFQLKKWSETQVTIRFWILSIIFALLGVATLKIR